MQTELIATQLSRKIYRASPVKFGLNRLTLILWKYLWSKELSEIRLMGTMSGSSYKMNFNLRDRIQFMAYVRGYHERTSEKLVSALLSEGGCFVDIGANIGFFSLLAATVSPKVQVYSFEPSGQNFQNLNKNLSLNSCRNVKTFQCALSDVGTETELVTLDMNRESGWNFIRQANQPLEDGARVEKISTQTLDKIFEENPSKPTLIKIDVEGHEYSVLKGGRAVLTAPGKRHVLIEINEQGLKKQNTSPDAVYRLLTEYGYHAFKIHRNGKLTACLDVSGDSAESNFLFSKE